MSGRERSYEIGESPSSSERGPQRAAETSAGATARRYDRYEHQRAPGAFTRDGGGRHYDRVEQRFPVDASLAVTESSGRFDLHDHHPTLEASSNSRIGRRRYDRESSAQTSYGRSGGRRHDRYDHPSLAESSSSQGGRARGRGVGQRALGGYSPTLPSEFTPVDSISHDLEERLTLQPPFQASRPPFSIPSQPSTSRTPAAAHFSSTVYIPPQRRNQAPRPPLTLLTRSTASGTRGESTQVHNPTPEVNATKEPQMSPASLQVATFAPRPGYGTVGKRCRITANHFRVELVDRNIHHYHVSITPEVTSRVLSRSLIKELVHLYGQSHLYRNPAYDGRRGIYTAGPLPFTSKEFMIKLEEGNDGTHERKKKEFIVKIRFATSTDIHNLREFLLSRQSNVPYEIIHALDVVLKDSLSNNRCTLSGKTFFPLGLGARSEIGNGVQCWNGFYQSLRPTQMGLSLNIDVSSKSFYEPIPVIEFAAKFLNLEDPSIMARMPLSNDDRLKLKKVLKGIKVEVTHGGQRRYKIFDITEQPTNQLRFTEDGQQKSVIQYFREKYNIVLRYASWPSLRSGKDSRPIYLPMETCTIVAGQRYAKKLNERQVASMLRMTCQRPWRRQEIIHQIADQDDYIRNDFVKEFGVNVSVDMAAIDARVLPPPALKYHDSGREKTIRPRTGQWNAQHVKLYHGAVVEYWMCVNFSNLKQEVVFNFCQHLVDMCCRKGMDFARNPLFPIQSSPPGQIEAKLSDVHHQCRVEGKQLQMLIIILPEVNAYYGKIKRICETELGMVSQCCQPRHARTCNRIYLENIVLKINVKAGGQNAILEDTLYGRIPLLTDIPTIIFGADVTHPQSGEDQGPSIAAVVASMDWPTVVTYRGLVSAQPHRSEIIEDLFRVKEDPKRGVVHAGMIRELLLAFKSSTGLKPLRIIFFRDGVSEGMFEMVLLKEMDAIRKACASLEEGYLPPVTFIVVQKRHNTRLFPTNEDNMDKSGNILPGTVVDTVICHPSEHDFYLCSHAGIRGTSRPAHYRVLLDENKFSADALQMLANDLCYTYARCTRSVSIVPPVYYAHLAAFRAKFYVERSGAQYEGGSSTGPDDRIELPEIDPTVKSVMFYC
ncbi:hypothetical protein VitviT2T_012636 [Vitis vinifera]|uniref:Protein argonaute MEL1 n=1 Tax=Vitis vinifera TaxID=29760 RepID=A0ABY9CFN9_VITVI|nr:protein argonaute 5 [Vitis vinifera]WJZ93715.1 hypothetical protein VitviT2T_012636 [Vitis vinifera]|eukprot:XP_010654011.1 PREDICTED: protein argonaute 5 isoform X1 [Vitis vinifera]